VETTRKILLLPVPKDAIEIAVVQEEKGVYVHQYIMNSE
jgi:hypothetical protein